MSSSAETNLPAADVAAKDANSVEVAEQLAKTQQRVQRTSGKKLAILEHPRQLEAVLRDAYQYFTIAAQAESRMSYAGEWLLDNYYIVQQALVQVGEDLPRGYYRELPKLATGQLAGYPRIYAVARAIVGVSNNQLTLGVIKGFVAAYQQVTPLTMGELWALPAMLRVGILEDLTLVIGQIAGGKIKKKNQQANDDISSGNPPDETVVPSSITSLRLLATQDWKIYFEDVSRVEQILRQDPADAYVLMDFETRNRYRHIIEQLAAHIALDEEHVALSCLKLAQAASDISTNGNVTRAESASDYSPIRTNHVGYYLMDEGRTRLEAHVGYQLDTGERLARHMSNHIVGYYLASIAMPTLFILAVVVQYATAAGADAVQLLGVSLLLLFPVSSLVSQVVNWLSSLSIPPRTLPKMDFSDGIPAPFRTIVVIPALVTGPEELDDFARQMELHYLRNEDEYLHVALLGDFCDAPAKHMPEDQALVDQGIRQMQALNEKYGRDGSGPFYFFMRERRWNLSDSVWMGWERKRGKLMEFNRLVLGGAEDTSLIVQFGDLSVLQHIRYVITLDADTVLPRDGARKLVGTLAHPLNRALFDAQERVIGGYTILQPRVEIVPASARISEFSRVFAGDTGLDLYTLAVSDVYQDLFAEGIYVGKGIYDVADFERSLAGRTPENALLSHDLFEGLLGRAALVTDVVLLEEFPPHYLAYAERLRRWLRGDWQLLPWLLPGSERASTRSRLSLLDTWKIIDNLRRSLVTPTLFVLLVAGWLWLPGTAVIWTVIALVLSSVPLCIVLLNAAIRSVYESDHSLRLQPARAAFSRWLLSLTLLPFEAILILQAIGTTLVRLVTHRQMLQWRTAAHAARLRDPQQGSGVVWRAMASAVLLTIAVGLGTAVAKPAALTAAAPFLVVWLLAPELVYRISRPITDQRPVLSARQQVVLRTLARRTWLFFEEFVGPQDHWLPPDHFQESPRGIVAHQTSPTNIGLLLTATIAAYDLGYAGVTELRLRLQFTFEHLAKLERHRGHFLNWYDTVSLKPLAPRYVSTVDSGNLAGCLFVLQASCRDLVQTPIIRAQRWQGLVDTLHVLAEELDRLEVAALKAQGNGLHLRLDSIVKQAESAQDHPGRRSEYVRQLQDEWQDFRRALLSVIQGSQNTADATTLNNIRIYSDRVWNHLANMIRDVELLLPWIPLLNEPPFLVSAMHTPQAIMEAWSSLAAVLETIPPLGEAPALCSAGRIELLAFQRALDHAAQDDDSLQDAHQWCARLGEALNSADAAALDLIEAFAELSEQAETFLQVMDFSFLYNTSRSVFHIGYNVDEERLDNSFYDLLASEARLASFIAIAKGDVPQSHWLHLGRPLKQVSSTQALVSWSGTMFEYLMPILLMRNHDGTLLGQSSSAVVRAQIDYAAQKQVPWGISESGYHAFDGNLNYQYRAFGIPALALKRGMASDLVVSPYASLIALAVDPNAVLQNVDRLKKLDLLNTYGFYEAVDYTLSRLALGESHAVVREYMAHHQGMILVSLVNSLLDDVMVRRFHSDPRIQSVELLLQEQIPLALTLQPTPSLDVSLTPSEAGQTNVAPWHGQVHGPAPQVHLLSNGDYSVLITSAGSGFSRWKSNALTRWRPDTTLDDWGTWIYVRDDDDAFVWSAAYQPTQVRPDSHSMLFYPNKAEFQRRDHDISVRMEITVAPNDDVELRRITLTNHSKRVRRLTVSSYGEVVLAPQETDRRHPAFNKMFIESEYIEPLGTLLFSRRPRSAQELPLYMVHTLAMVARSRDDLAYETDRRQFLGRGQTPQSPVMLRTGKTLSGSVGATLDPSLALSQVVQLEPYESVQLAYVIGAGDSREQVLKLATTFSDWSNVELAFDQSRYQSELDLRQTGVETPELERYQKLLSALLYPYYGWRAPEDILAANVDNQSGLWANGISGDYPILLVRIGDEAELDLVSDLLQAHRYWRSRQIMITLVILNQRDSGYLQELYNQVHRFIVRSGSETWINRHEGIFILRADQLQKSGRILLETAARVYLDGSKGALAAQVDPPFQNRVPLPLFTPPLSTADTNEPTPALLRPEQLQFDNGYGGFSADGREYVITVEAGQQLPAPWINVIANRNFGFFVSESGGGMTWSGNSSEYRLTNWRNDPVTDMPSEAIYLRDEETGAFWSSTPLPAGTTEAYVVSHGHGYSFFEHHSYGLKQKLGLSIVEDAAVKIMHLRLENTWSRTRRITATYYAELVLGTTPDVTKQYLVPEFEAEHQTLLIRNPYSQEFGETYTFISASKAFHGLTTDRSEFLGRMGTMRQPAALGRIGLSGTIRAGDDLCAAVQVHIDLLPGSVEEVFFVIGTARNRAEALELAAQYRHAERLRHEWQRTVDYWKELTTTITVKTPDSAMNVLLPWLLYQTLSCRIWGRSALYQSSGAFGFRDQLQDSMALLYARPDLAREHILDAAAHQFDAGDVLHWWHPPSGRGVRTRFSDDLLWLPYVVAEYITATGDSMILDEKIPFLTGEPLKPEEEERYGFYESTAESYTLYEHCRRSLAKGTTAGVHGLPLIGTGDWNDGMNRVGIGGRGESVWVGWFLYAVIGRFLPYFEREGDHAEVENYQRWMNELRQALEQNAWDGKWYVRAYYDDGTPLGSAANEECRIDSIAQSWSVLSGAGSPERVQQAMESVLENLVKVDDQLVLLFTPPFDETSHDPGYIKGYVPGIRENGGQYTHAALWAVWAFAELGRGNDAHKLFDLLNPINHSDSQAKAQKYRVEPYVVAADVYSVAPYVGRGGWTWYTGSSGWMYRLEVTAILGLSRHGEMLNFAPCIPETWSGFELNYRYRATTYKIMVRNPDRVCIGIQQLIVDGEEAPATAVALVDDGQEHLVEILMGTR